MSTHTYPGTVHDWIEGTRPHTWANAFSPVIVGTGAAAYGGNADWVRAILAFVVAWALIIGVNFANDYSDGIRGTDEDRTGPARLTGGGLAKPEHVKYAAFICFATAGVSGITLSLLSSWWLIPIGALCILAAWFYTGGKNPYGYRGLGEVAVFVFFGLVAVLGTQFTQLGTVTWVGVASAIAIGAISSSVNMANNIRDIPSDTATGKVTLAVRLGDKRARSLFAVLSFVPFVVSLLLAFVWWPFVLGALAAPLVIPGVHTILSGATGRELIPVLGGNGRAMLLWALITAGVCFFGA